MERWIDIKKLERKAIYFFEKIKKSTFRSEKVTVMSSYRSVAEFKRIPLGL